MKRALLITLIMVFLALLSYAAWPEAVMKVEGNDVYIWTRLYKAVVNKTTGFLEDYYTNTRSFSKINLDSDKKRAWIFKYGGDGYDVLVNEKEASLTTVSLKINGKEGITDLLTRDNIKLTFLQRVNVNGKLIEFEKTYIFHNTPNYTHEVRVKVLKNPINAKISVIIPRIGPINKPNESSTLFISYTEKHRKILMSSASSGVLNSKGIVNLGKTNIIDIKSYMGPVKVTLITRYLDNTDNVKKIIRSLPKGYKWYDTLFYAMVHSLDWLYSITRNYGWAIIVFTVLIRLVLYPLFAVQTKSMAQNMKIQPEMEKIKKKYKDPKKQQEELMKLYKKHGVNPMGGCLPLLIQMPIFFLLYGVIIYFGDQFPYSSRFFIWNDLSKGGIQVNIVFILLEVVISVYQSTLTARDKKQVWQSSLMFIVFSFFIVYLPSGLFLYYTVSSALQLLQTAYINKKLGIEGMKLRELFATSKR
ncbi:MAG: YidC/Oxa1 family membrane protein insertase [Thermotogae bacterium]|nr:YidC/Oxa1 family membrane protein insertase [Thermotogota bacterium]